MSATDLLTAARGGLTVSSGAEPASYDPGHVRDRHRTRSEGRVALITLNRPEARNAVNGDVAQGMEAAIDQLENDDEVWVGVLQANTEGQTNPVFCAGADLKAINSGNAASLNTKRGGFAGFAYRERRKPIVVAVDGLATAGGCEIVLACRSRRRHHTVGVRSGRGQAQPDRRRRRAVPPAAGDRPGRRDGGDPDR